VTLDGGSLPTKVIVHFVPSNGVAVIASVEEDGSYSLPAPVPPGEAKVAIIPVPSGSAGGGPIQPGRGDASATRLPAAKRPEVPIVYQDSVNLRLTYQVDPGDNNIDIELSSSAR
jgi:hypothetical protein